MRVIIFVLFIMSCVTACDRSTPLKWKEEIQLHDGRKLIVERADLMGGWAEPGQTGAPRERTLKFADPDSPQKKYSHMITGSSNYLLLDFYNGVPWLIVHVGPFNTDTRCPIGTYETFTWIDGAWQSVSYTTLPKRFLKPNMSVSSSLGERYAGKTVSAAQIAEEIEKTKRNGALESAWRLVEGNVHGRPIDCDHYRKLEEGMKK